MRAKKLEKGMLALSSAVLFFIIAGAVTVAAVSSANGANLAASKAGSKTEADALAEAGVNALYDQVWRQYFVDGTYPSSLAATPLTSTFGGVTKTCGQYSAVVTDCQLSQQTLPCGHIENYYTFLITGTGTASDGTISTVSATFAASMEVQPSATETSFGFQDAAIQSNTSVNFVTDQGIRTYSSSDNANIYASQGITWSTLNTTKSSDTNPNIFSIQGAYEVADSPTSAYLTMTQSASGLGNSNGSTNYQNPANSSIGANTNSITGVNPWPFPNASQVVDLEQAWLNAATNSSESTTYNGDVGSGSLPTQSGLDGQVLKAPCIINGNLNIASGGTVSLLPTDSNPANNVVYVTGNVQNLGNLENLGVTVVMLGDYSDTPGASYNIMTQGSPYTQAQAVTNSALISTSPDANAISISTNSSSNYGMVYAAQGGINVTSDVEITGALVCGSSTAGVGINIAPVSGNSFVVNYDPNALANKPMFTVPGNYTNGVSVPFTPQSLNNWTYH